MTSALPVRLMLRLFSCNPSKHVPAIYITKKMDILLMLEESVHGPSLEFGPAELGGFNTGTIVRNEVEEFEGWTCSFVCLSAKCKFSLVIWAYFAISKRLLLQELTASHLFSPMTWSLCACLVTEARCWRPCAI